MASTRLVEQIGRVLGGRYRLLAPLGTGASAHVFLADDVSLRRRVAVKVLHPALAEDSAFLRRFRAEARAAAALSHPHVMAVFDWGEDDDNGPFLVCEYLGGGSLRALLDAGHRLSPAQACHVGLQAARGLAYAHRRGLVHRDIKPANLLFDEDGRLRIADFGLARALAEAAWTEPAGAVLGTARYASPEQARGASVEGRSDIYSLAMVLVEAVTGRVPFAADTTIATLMGRLETPIVAPDELGRLKSVVERAGMLDPAQRPDATALVTALEVAAGDLPKPLPLPLAHSSALDDTLAVVDPDPTTMPRSAAGDDGPMASPAGRRRRRWPAFLLAVLALLVLAGGALALTRGLTSRPPPPPSHPVPDVVNLDEPTAVAKLQALKFALAYQRPFLDNTKPGQVTGQDPPPGVPRKEGETVTLTVSQGPPPVPVPDLTGLARDDAAASLAQAGLTVGDVATQYNEQAPRGQVLDWSPKGQSIPKGSGVALVVSDGPAPRTIPQGLTGKSYDEAAAILQGLGLVPQRKDDFNDTIPPGQVIGTQPGYANSVPRGTKVLVSVSKGPDLVAVPAIAGKPVDQATAILQQSGLTVAGVFGPSGSKGSVVTANPAEGQQVKRGTGVVLYTT